MEKQLIEKLDSALTITDFVPTYAPLDDDIVCIIPRAKTLPRQVKQLSRQNTLPISGSSKLPRDTTQFITFLLFRIWHRVHVNDLVDFENNVDFLHSFLSKTGLGMTVMLLALLYVSRLRNVTTTKQENGSEFRVYVVALILAQKWLRDSHLGTNYWSKTSGIDTKSLRSLEFAFLEQIDWKIWCSREEFERWQMAARLLSKELLNRNVSRSS